LGFSWPEAKGSLKLLINNLSNGLAVRWRQRNFRAGGVVSTSSRPHGTITCTISASNFSRRITRFFRANSWLAKLSLLGQFPGVSHGAPRMGNPFQMV
jgi:hypothetical protein